mmetsp:Transcript_40280/g.115117  ORF Transcript_40280/g.115117 Transcript_40280/m.115117 type:complete len:118 (+) Transcript_40280:2-355(+)
MARSMAYRAGSSEHIFATFYVPWVELARELGFSKLAASLGSCRPREWRENRMRSTALAPDASRLEEQQLHGVSAREFHACINDWFDTEVNPLLIALRMKACPGSTLRNPPAEGQTPG